MVGILKKVFNFGIAMVRYKLEGGEKVQEHVWQERMNICETCPLNKAGECGLCGCPVERKALLSTEQCPDGKWQKQQTQETKVQKKTGISANVHTNTRSKRDCQKCKKRTK